MTVVYRYQTLIKNIWWSLFIKRLINNKENSDVQKKLNIQVISDNVTWCTANFIIVGRHNMDTSDFLIPSRMTN